MTRSLSRFRRSRRGGIFLVLLGGALLLTPATVGAAEEFSGSFNMSAHAAGMMGNFGNPSSQPYPVANGSIPETYTTFGNGPAGTAQATAGWPGPLVGNAGSFAGILVHQCPTINCTAADYPVRAQAATPGGKREDTLGPLTAKAEEDFTEARGSAADFSSGAVSAGRSSTRSRTFVEDEKVTAFSESITTGITTGGGVVKIDSVKTLARIVSDGERVTTERQMVVNGFEFAGQPATVDENGMRFSNQSSNPLDPAITQANDQLLKSFNVKVFLSKPSEAKGEGGSAALSTGSLVVVWDFFGSGNLIIITIGGSTVRVQATAGDQVTLEDVAPPVADLGGAFGGTASLPAGGVGTGDVVGLPAAPSGAASLPSGGDEPIAASFDTEPASYFDGVSPETAVLAAIGALILGTGLLRLRNPTFAQAGSACPNDRRTRVE